MNVSRVLDHFFLEMQIPWANEEGIQLIASRRAVRANLVVEGNDLVAVVRAEDGDVAGVVL